MIPSPLLDIPNLDLFQLFHDKSVYYFLKESRVDGDTVILYVVRPMECTMKLVCLGDNFRKSLLTSLILIRKYFLVFKGHA